MLSMSPALLPVPVAPSAAVWASRCVIGVLVVCMGLQGLVSAAQWAVSRAHVHRVPVSAALHAELLEVRLAGQHSHGARQWPVARADAGGHQAATPPDSAIDPADEPALEPAAAHHHADIGHHHHDANDATVVAVADADRPEAAATEHLAARTAQDTWAILNDLPDSLLSKHHAAFWPAAHASVCSVSVMPLERPPRA